MLYACQLSLIILIFAARPSSQIRISIGKATDELIEFLALSFQDRNSLRLSVIGVGASRFPQPHFKSLDFISFFSHKRPELLVLGLQVFILVLEVQDYDFKLFKLFSVLFFLIKNTL